LVNYPQIMGNVNTIYLHYYDLFWSRRPHVVYFMVSHRILHLCGASGVIFVGAPL
jgi:hypothetical protein